jgi:amidase
MSELFLSERFQYTWGPNPPTLEIDSGASLRVVCPDSDNGMADASQLPETARQQSSGTKLFPGNPLAGPIFVRGAAIGDTIAVTIDGIELDRATGATLFASNHGLLSRDQLLGDIATTADNALPRHLYQWSIDRQHGKAIAANPCGAEPIKVPLRPMIGSIGVCPRWGQSISSLFAGDFGGNLDVPLLRAKTTIFLPVFAEGALLALGDIHAAQGDGEIVGGGIETSGVASITIRTIRSRLETTAVAWPRIFSGANIYAVATNGDLRIAISSAYARLVDWLATGGGLDRRDGYQLISQCGELRLGGIVVPNHSTVAAGISLDRLPTKCRQEIVAWLESAGQ